MKLPFRSGILVLLALFSFSSPAAKPVRKAAKENGPKLLTSRQAYEKARTVALAWQPDALLADLTTLSTSPMDRQRRSAEWKVDFISKSARKRNLMTVENGKVTPYVVDGGGEVIEVEEGTLMDTAKLMTIAEENGGNLFPDARIEAGVVQNRNGPLWHITYSDAEGNTLLHLAIEGNSGKATQL